ncbi:MAG: ComEA family DNA-binding protein [Candidatus Omnitrophota bacterium]
MLVLTRHEKTVILFFVCVLFFGSVLQLIKKKHFDATGFISSPPIRKININSATREEWESLPMIGEYRASRILEAREERGRFSSVEDVRFVKGIGPEVFKKIKEFLTE